MNGTVQIPLQMFYTAHSKNKTLAWELCSCAHYLLRTDGQQYKYNQALNKQTAISLFQFIIIIISNWHYMEAASNNSWVQ